MFRILAVLKQNIVDLNYKYLRRSDSYLGVMGRPLKKEFSRKSDNLTDHTKQLTVYTPFILSLDSFGIPAGRDLRFHLSEAKYGELFT